jgi:uncharacterized repeat protein (TIGR02543 family)
VLLALLLVTVGAEQAGAATFTAACSGAAGDAASLVSAITSANSTAGPDTVSLGQGCDYSLTAVNNYWYGPDGLPAITSNITIEGNGATIERSAAMGTPTFRLFYVAADPANPNTFSYVVPAGTASGGGQLTLLDLTLTGGLAKGGDSNGGGGGAGFGGAVFNQGIVVIARSALTANLAQGGSSINTSAGSSGGGIGSNATFTAGGGFGPGVFGGGTGGAGAGGGGGGAGFVVGENGAATIGAAGANGGGPATGLGGVGGSGVTVAGAAGDGSGGGGGSNTGFLLGGGSGGGFGEGGSGDFGGEAGGGGVGGGGGERSGTSLGAGGGGFGGGGGGAVNGASMVSGGAGGFGGGGGRSNSNGGTVGRSGFGGGYGTNSGGGGGAGMGGAIFNMQGSLTIRNSTVASNEARGGTDNVTDHGKGYGGAVFNMDGSFTAEDSTFANNTALDASSSIYNLAYDAAIARTAQTTLRDTIVADAPAHDDLASDHSSYIIPANQSSALADVGHFDLVRVIFAAETGTVTGAPLSSDPLLGPLQNNGGPTPTMAPAPTSPAIDAGSAFSLSTDQRGDPRPLDFSGIANASGGDGSDIGAYEWQRCIGQASPTQACHTVTVALAGTGKGAVSDGAAISCPGACVGSYVEGTTLALTANPATGSDFTGWSGACTGTGACNITVDADKTATATFTQRPPAVASSAPSSTSATSATLVGAVNPLGSATSYHFEFGRTSAYGRSVPVPDASAGSDTVSHAESQPVTALTPGTTYHFRIVATNAGGTAYGADTTFTTAALSPPALSGLTLRPSRFRAAKPGASTRRRPPIGTTISYRDTTRATTTFTVARTTTGLRSGKRCVAHRAPLPRGARRCSLLVKVGTFRHADTPGSNRLRFGGRVRGKALSPHSYVMLATASGPTGTSKRLTARFVVVR